jgi:hypothetical protein
MNLRLCPAFFIAILVAAACGLVGCRKPFVRVYLAPKDIPDSAGAHSHSETPVAAASKPQLSYKLPPGWTETTPNSVSLAAFSIKSGTAEANVAITPLPNLAGREALVVNMWREQAGLPPIDEAELDKTLETVEIAGEKGQMFEVLGALEGGAPLRIITAFVHQRDASWFYKLAGEEALVAAQKPAFVEFLKSVRVKAPGPGEAKNGSEPPAALPSPATPPGWTALTPGQMQIAKFAVPEKDGAKAEVSVSVFPSDTGGTLANVNRWRKQIGLGEIDEAALPASVKPLEGPNGAVLVDLKNESRALLGAIMPRDGQWYFYKLLGDAAAVESAREQFVAYAKGEAR